METTSQNLHHLFGEPAYLIYCQQAKEYKARLSTFKALHVDLEVIVDEVGNLLAYRYNEPYALRDLVYYGGGWHIGKHSISMTNEIQDYLRLFINQLELLSISRN